MNDYIHIKHELPYFSVTKSTYERKSLTGKTILITEGKCTYPLRRKCPNCGAVMDIHGHRIMRIQDYEMLGHIHIICLSVTRMKCRHCNHTEMQQIPFKSEHHQLTSRLEQRLRIRINNGSTIEDTARQLSVHPSIVKEISKEYLKSQEYLNKPAPAAYIGIDEFLLHKGHRYATVVQDLETGHILFLEKGKKKEQAEHFISSMGKKWMSNVKAVAMDMNAQYDSAFREYAPHVKIVYDKFHMVKMFNDTVLSAMRKRKQAECLEHGNREGYSLLKGSRYLLLSSPETLAAKEKAARENNRRLHETYTSRGLSLPPGERLMRINRDSQLRDLLSANTDLNVAYILLEQFKLAYDVNSEEEMKKGLGLWYRLAEQSGVPEIRRFMNTIKRHEDGIVNRVAHKITSGIVEGTNNMIKTVRRKAYGFRDTEYFFLRIMFESYKPRFRYVSHKILC